MTKNTIRTIILYIFSIAFLVIGILSIYVGFQGMSIGSQYPYNQYDSLTFIFSILFGFLIMIPSSMAILGIIVKEEES